MSYSIILTLKGNQFFFFFFFNFQLLGCPYCWHRFANWWNQILFLKPLAVWWITVVVNLCSNCEKFNLALMVG